MPAHRLAYAWIACFAVLFNLLAMPLSASAAKAPAEQLLWGAFCSTDGTKLIAVSIGQLDPGQSNDDHAVMQHCWCCSGSSPALALPGTPAQLALPAHALASALDAQHPALPTPRERWPALNPRASPPV